MVLQPGNDVIAGLRLDYSPASPRPEIEKYCSVIVSIW